MKDKILILTTILLIGCSSSDTINPYTDNGDNSGSGNNGGSGDNSNTDLPLSLIHI